MSRSRNVNNSIPVHVGARVVGSVYGDVFRKHVRGSAHFLRRPPAIALDVQSIADAESAGAMWAEIHDTESGKVYRARLSSIRAYGAVFNRGFGQQIYLPLSAWGHDEDPSQIALFAEALA